jgi:hypothetical protein
MGPGCVWKNINWELENQFPIMALPHTYLGVLQQEGPLAGCSFLISITRELDKAIVGSRELSAPPSLRLPGRPLVKLSRKGG